MNVLERNVKKFDSFQQKHRPFSFVFGVTKRYGDIHGGALVAQLTYAMFTTIFPLLLLLVTVLTLFLADDSALKQTVLNSTFSQFPVVGSQLGNNIHALRRDSIIGLVIAIVVLIYGSTALASAGMYAMQQIWKIPAKFRFNFATRLLRGLTFILVLGFGLVLTTLLSGFSTLGKHNLYLRIATVILAAIINVAIYLAAFRALTPRIIATEDLVDGAIFGGIAWTILQAFGSYIIGHYLRKANATYGVFGSVLGLLAWLYFGAQITIYAAVANSVIKHHLWPRSITQPSTDNH